MFITPILLTATVFADRPIPQTPEELTATVHAAFTAADEEVAAIIAIENDQRTFENTVGALDDMMARLDGASNIPAFMAYVHTDKNIRDAAQGAIQLWSDWSIDFATNEDLYNAIKAYADTNPKLSGEQARMLEHTMREYRRSGMALSKEDREQLKTIQKELGTLEIEFDTNIREDKTIVPIPLGGLEGVPQDVVDRLEVIDGVYQVTLEYPTFGPIMDYCSVSDTRKAVRIAYSKRAGQENVDVLERIIKLRDEASDLLGYATTADYETEVKMSKNAATVADFYKKLRPVVRKKAEKDWAELVAAKREDLGDPEAEFYQWDFSYYYEKIKNNKYSVDSQQVQEYLPLQNVMDGLFEITQNLYGLEYREVTENATERGTPLWHEDVRLFEVWDTNTGKQLGEFYIDLHPRDDKYSHAAQWGLVQHKVWDDGTEQLPVAALVCNFTKPTADKPSLMTHDEAETFFHEFGHCLHTILSEAKIAGFAGTSVERDFVEAPSQMFEEWVWTPETLSLFAKHYETGEPMPEELIEGMIAAKNLQSGTKTESQIFLGMIDQAYHTDEDGVVDTTQVAYDIHDMTRMYPHTPGTHFQGSFGHLTGYQAGYYGYMWSLVYAQDMFQRFKELGMLSPEAGAYYREKILSKGGTEDSLDLVTAYLGREPSMNPFLESLGLEVENPVDVPGESVFGTPMQSESGLQWWVIDEGDTSARQPKPTDLVKVHYSGWLEDGTKFDSSVDRGQPATFPLNRVIPGWTEGLGNMHVGASYKLRIPAHLAYGSRGRPSIPPDSTLIFDVELIDIMDYAKVPPMEQLPGDPVTGEATTSDSGLSWYDMKEGGGPQPAGATSTVEVHYTGWLNDGTKFDSSVDRGQTISFPLNGVIAGWTEGVGSMHVGGKRKLVIPSNLGYGPNGMPPVIPGGATLIFDVELVSVTD
ncbi:MAG: M3 family metallopeptidase [Phycisphaerales bacterium]|jgi:thimet oligopeptidase|nr:M3 family metallopeptidase [Phycisphaerales bacterium]